MRIVAGVAALVLGYIALVVAVQVLALGATAEGVIIRLLMSILILQLIRAAMRASKVALEILGHFRMALYKLLDREGIIIPFPQRDLWVRQLP